MSTIWLIVNEAVAYKRTINSTNAVELWYIGKYLYKVRFKWENKISKKSMKGEREVVSIYKNKGCVARE